MLNNNNLFFPAILITALGLLNGCVSLPINQPSGEAAATQAMATGNKPLSVATDLTETDQHTDNTENRPATILPADYTEPDPEHNILGAEEIAAHVIEDANAPETSVTLTHSALADAVITQTEAEMLDEQAAEPQPQHDLWQRIRTGMLLPEGEHSRTQAEIKWYASHPDYINRTIKRATPYLHLIVEEVERRGLPTELALLPIVESAFQPFAYSHGRAAGIWQFIPSTGRIYGLKQDWWYDGRRDIEAATKAALSYLDNLNRSFDGDWLLALAAYNSGQGTVKKAISKNRRKNRATDFWSLKLPRETRSYVPKLLAISAIIKQPEDYGIHLKPLPDAPYLTKVDIGTQIDLALAAEMAGTTLQELYLLNPAFNRWATSPDGPHSLLLPIDKAEGFSEKLAELPSSKRIKWRRHRIREGETLGHIANKYRTTVALLRRVNKLSGNMIRTGHTLIIPVATKNMNSYSLSAAQRIRTIQSTPKNGTRILHTVHKGDTLWDISRKYHTGVRQLARWNGIAPRDYLHAGQKLVIWRTAAKPAMIDINPDLLSMANGASTQKINYIVRSGDSLSRISQKFRVTVSELRQWNSLAREKYLQPGQRLTLYVDVTRQSGNI